MNNKTQWHKKYKKEAFVYFNGMCQKCKRNCVYLNYGVIHHNTYKHKGGIYNASFSELVKLGKVTWVCEECHEEIHRNESIDGITNYIYTCIVCNEFEWKDKKYIPCPICEWCSVGADWNCECGNLIDDPLKTGNLCVVCYGVKNDNQENWQNLEELKRFEEEQLLNLT